MMKCKGKRRSSIRLADNPTKIRNRHVQGKIDFPKTQERCQNSRIKKGDMTFHAVVPHMIGATVQNLVACSTWLSRFVLAFASSGYKSEALPLHINLFGRPILITPEATITTCGKWRCGSSHY